MNEILTTEQAASLLQFSTPYVRTLAMRGEIPAVKWGDDWRFVKQQLIEHVCQLAIDEQKSRKFDYNSQAQQTPCNTTLRKRGRPRVVRI